MKRLSLAALGTVLLYGSIFFMPVVPAWGKDAGQRAYERGDYAAALREFGEDGSAEAQMMLGIMYLRGRVFSRTRKGLQTCCLRLQKEAT